MINHFFNSDFETLTLDDSKKCMRIFIPSILRHLRHKTNNNDSSASKINAKKILRLLCIAAFKNVFKPENFDKLFKTLKK